MAKCYVSTKILLSPLSPLHRSTTIRHTRLSDLTPIELASPVQNFATVHYDIYTYTHHLCTILSYAFLSTLLPQPTLLLLKSLHCLPRHDDCGNLRISVANPQSGPCQTHPLRKEWGLELEYNQSISRTKTSSSLSVVEEEKWEKCKSVGCAFKNRRLS